MDPAFRHVVVGLDLHPKTGALTAGSVSALAHARWLADHVAVRCTLLHSRREDEFWDPGEGGYAPSPGGHSPEKAVEAARAELARAGIQVEQAVVEERAWLAITRLVLDGPADLVVVGKRTEVEPGGPPVGGAANKLLRQCPCAVWVVRPGSEPPPRRVLVATDLSAVGERALQRAAFLAERSGAELHVVHALQLTMRAQLRGSEEEFLARVGEEAKAKIADTLARVGYSERPHVHVGLTTPTRAVLECTARYAADLVVLGTISRGGVAGLLLGNTAERLLQRLDTSLLTVKPADFVCPVSPAPPAR